MKEYIPEHRIGYPEQKNGFPEFGFNDWKIKAMQKGFPGGSTKTILPQKLIVSPALYTEEMDSLTGWAKVGATATMALNNTEYKHGTGSIKLTTASGALQGIYRSGLTWNLSDVTRRNFSIWAYFHSAPSTTVSKIIISLYSGAGFGNFVKKELYSNHYGASFFPNMWNELKINSTGWATGAGTMNWSDIRGIEIDVQALSSQIASVSFDYIQPGIVYKKAVIIDFDDADTSVYLKAFPRLQAKRMRGNFFVISDSVDTAGKITKTQLLDMYNNGWNIGNHTKAHQDLTAMTQAQQVTAFQGCKDWLIANGMPNYAEHISYPFYRYNTDTIAALGTFGAKTGRTGPHYNWCEYNEYHDQYLYNTSPAYSFPFEIECQYIVYNENISQVTTRLNNAIAIPGTVIHLLFHYIVDSGATDNNYTLTSIFQGVLDYLEANDIQSLTIDEWYRLNSGPITVNHK